MVSPTGAARKRLLGVALCALLALTVSAVPASAAQRESVCAGAHGKLHLRSACRFNERRLPFVRARSAGSSKTIATCENKKGALRVIKSSGKCHHGEKKLVWSVQGVAGPAGPAGTVEEVSLTSTGVYISGASGGVLLSSLTHEFGAGSWAGTVAITVEGYAENGREDSWVGCEVFAGPTEIGKSGLTLETELGSGQYIGEGDIVIPVAFTASAPTKLTVKCIERYHEGGASSYEVQVSGRMVLVQGARLTT